MENLILILLQVLRSLTLVVCLAFRNLGEGLGRTLKVTIRFLSYTVGVILFIVQGFLNSLIVICFFIVWRTRGCVTLRGIITF